VIHILNIVQKQLYLPKLVLNNFSGCA